MLVGGQNAMVGGAAQQQFYNDMYQYLVQVT